eukprot:Sspe_Gene.9378::Locus_3149_Transcript_1_1_Confidence_1.000_Length_1094::g.9378::m.9378
MAGKVRCHKCSRLRDVPVGATVGGLKRRGMLNPGATVAGKDGRILSDSDVVDEEVDTIPRTTTIIPEAGWSTISAGESHFAAIIEGGRKVVTWGLQGYKGAGAFPEHSEVAARHGTRFVSVAAGGSIFYPVTVALASDGTATGYLGKVTTAKHVACGRYVAAAVLKDGSIVAHAFRKDGEERAKQLMQHPVKATQIAFDCETAYVLGEDGKVTTYGRTAFPLDECHAIRALKGGPRDRCLLAVLKDGSLLAPSFPSRGVLDASIARDTFACVRMADGGLDWSHNGRSGEIAGKFSGVSCLEYAVAAVREDGQLCQLRFNENFPSPPPS